MTSKIKRYYGIFKSKLMIKILKYKFKKENDKLLDVLGGQFEGKMCSPSDLKEISALPSQEQMRAEFLGVLEAPLSGLVSVMEGAMTGVVSCMDQQVQKKESEQ